MLAKMVGSIACPGSRRGIPRDIYQRETMTSMNIEKLLQETVGMILEGDLTKIDLTCPVCNKADITFSFSEIPESQRYGLFVTCKQCKYRIHYNLNSKPKNFSDNYVIKEYQDLENKVAKLKNDEEYLSKIGFK